MRPNKGNGFAQNILRDTDLPVIQSRGCESVRRIGKSLMQRCDLVCLVGNVVNVVDAFCNVRVFPSPEVEPLDVDLYERHFSVRIGEIYDGALEMIRFRILKES